MSKLAGTYVANVQYVERVISPLVSAHSLTKSDVASAVRDVAMHSVMDARTAAWYVHDFYLAHGRLPTRDDF